MKVTTTKGELVNLMNGLYDVKTLKGRTFGLNVCSNIDSIKDCLQDLEEKSSPTPEFVKLSEQMHKLTMEEQPSEKIQALEEENIDIIEGRKLQIKEVRAILTEDVSLNLEELKKDSLPEEISADQIMKLKLILV